MSAPKKSVVPEDKLALYEKLIASFPGNERKGVANHYTSLNGYMSALLSPSGVMALRLPEEERQQ